MSLHDGDDEPLQQHQSTLAPHGWGKMRSEKRPNLADGDA
jgi:hypothetical protein